MGQICCKDCTEHDRYKKSAIVSCQQWEDDDDYDDHNTYSTGTISSLKSSPTSNNDIKRRNNRIKNKKRNVILHAEFRDRHNLLAPPLVTEGVMIDTDNVFTGQDLGVNYLYNTDSSSNLFGDIPQDSSYESTTVESASGEELDNNILVLRKDDGLKELNFR